MHSVSSLIKIKDTLISAEEKPSVSIEGILMADFTDGASESTTKEHIMRRV